MNFSQAISEYEPQSDIFATHLNLLRLIGPGITSVLELGAGQFSTRTFLSRRYYPNLGELVTVEQDRKWVIAEDDPRHKIVICPEPIELFLEDVSLDAFDLIFVDNSLSLDRRCDTLKWVASHIGRSLVVAHDFERTEYQDASAGLTLILVDDRQVPWTALLWRKR
jgi:hypothetical protein